MRESVFLRCFLACGLLVLGAACGDDGSDEGAGGSGGPAAGGGGTGGGGMIDDPTPKNEDCPGIPGLPQYATKGKCCYRYSNSLRVMQTTGDKAVLEYRSNLFTTANQPASASSALLKGSATMRFDNDEQSILFRYELPYSNGQFQKGMGTVRIGVGKANCDGTYSFYGASAAPRTTNFTDPARWEVRSSPVNFDPAGATGQDQVKPVWAVAGNKEPSHTPFISTMGTKPLEWESVSLGFTVLDSPKLTENLDCIGSRADASRWMAGGQTVHYQPIDLNNKDTIPAIANITLSQLFAFGPVGAVAVGNAEYNPEMAPRCMPELDNPMTTCKWKKLPDSLCPTDAAQTAMWRCHLGYEGNPDNAPTKCTATAPTTALDPDMGATSEGQCCDPLGKNTNGLPACNAYRVTTDFVAAAVEITDEPANSPQGSCQ